MAYERKDHYYRRAKKEGKASRAVYKLTELNERFRILRAGQRIVDLGCAPGGWIQEAARLVGPSGRVVGIDLVPLAIPLPAQVVTMTGNMEDDSVLATIKEHLAAPADGVLSDMAPHTSGVPFADAYRSYTLAMRAFIACGSLLRVGGFFVVKIFPGSELKEYDRELRQHFQKVATVRPAATRKTSTEIYLVCTGYKKCST